MDKLLKFCLLILSIIVQMVIWNMGYNIHSVLIYQVASAHFYGVPVLQNKTAGDNSTKINISILGKDGKNINSVFSSLIIKSKDTGEILKRFPYGFYEFSDMTFSYTFPKVGTYLLTLESKINGDPSYSQNPLLVDLELPVVGGVYSLTFAQSLTFYLIVAIAVIAAITFYLRTRRK